MRYRGQLPCSSRKAVPVRFIDSYNTQGQGCLSVTAFSKHVYILTFQLSAKMAKTITRLAKNGLASLLICLKLLRRGKQKRNKQMVKKLEPRKRFRNCLLVPKIILQWHDSDFLPHHVLEHYFMLWFPCLREGTVCGQETSFWNKKGFLAQTQHP